jgi:hypothetical protein
MSGKNNYVSSANISWVGEGKFGSPNSLSAGRGRRWKLEALHSVGMASMAAIPSPPEPSLHTEGDSPTPTYPRAPLRLY